MKTNQDVVIRISDLYWYWYKNRYESIWFELMNIETEWFIINRFYRWRIKNLRIWIQFYWKVKAKCSVKECSLDLNQVIYWNNRQMEVSMKRCLRNLK